MSSMAPMMMSMSLRGTLKNLGSRPVMRNSISACSLAVYALPGPEERR
jgi:hypothetical protein